MALHSSGRDRLLGGLAYAGMFVPLLPLALVVCIVLDNLGRIRLTTFLKYHCYQALILNIVFYFLPGFISTAMKFLAGLLDLTVVFAKTGPILLQFSSFVTGSFGILILAVTIYGMLWTFMGKYTHIPVISQGVNMFLR